MTADPGDDIDDSKPKKGEIEKQVEITLTPELKEKFGIENQAELNTLLDNAITKGKTIEEIKNLGVAIAEQARNTSEVLNKFIESQTQDMEAQKFEEIAKSKLVEIYKGLPDGDDQKEQIKLDISKQLGIGDAETLLDAEGLTKALQVPMAKSNPMFEETRDMRKAFDMMMLYVAAKKGAIADEISGKVKVDPRIVKHCADLFVKQNLPGAVSLQKAIDTAMDSVTAGEGLEWVPAQVLSRNLYQDIWLALQVAGNFSRFAMPGTASWEVPIRTSRARLYRASQATAYNEYFTNKFRASNMGTDTVAFAAEKTGVLLFLSDELVDDAAIAMLSEAYDELVYANSEGIEDAVLNGSSSLADLDNAGADTHKLWNNAADAGDGIRLNTGAVDARNLWDGIRKNLNTAAKTASSTFGADELLAVRKTMGKYGVKPEDLMLVVSPQTYINMLGFDEVTTLEKYGAGATILRGELARIHNIPIIVSGNVRNDYDNTGVYTHGTVVGGSSGVANETQVLLVHKRAYAFADRMTMRVESERQFLSGQRAILASARLDFQKMFASTEITEAALNSVAV